LQLHRKLSSAFHLAYDGLMSDAEQMKRVFKNSPFIRVASATGNPPDVYQIEYRVKSL
jgi:hypothetical protein